MYDLTSQRVLAGAAGAGAKLYVEDVFSTWLYTGNGSTQTITNGIDLAGEGGLVWLKARNLSGYDNILIDTARGNVNNLVSNSTAAAFNVSSPGYITFGSSGFDLAVSGNIVNDSGLNGASWTFRKAAKFFDVVTYTGTGSARTVAHNLGSVPGTIIIKRTDSTDDWLVYHRSVGATKGLYLNDTSSEITASTFFNNTEPTSTVFTVGTNTKGNANGGTYVAYLFAHDAGGFGDSGNDSVVSCGSYTGNGTSQDIELGWEPQWVLIKNTSAAANWVIYDTMRGFASSGDSQALRPNLSDSEQALYRVHVAPTGFKISSESNVLINTNGNTYIYIAIRRGPMKTPTDATEVFHAKVARDASSTSVPSYSAPITVDLAFSNFRSGDNTNVGSRLQGARRMFTNTTGAETSSTDFAFDYQTGWGNLGGASSNFISWMFRRAPGFFDVVAYTGTGSARTVSHNLGVAPELMIVKKRNGADSWFVYSASSGNTQKLVLNTTAGLSTDSCWNNTSPTSSVFSVGAGGSGTNDSGDTYIAYLFASCPGVSKVGSYTGTGTTQQINCGFTSGARFVLIKRTDSTGDWYVWDSARGIVAGNDPYLLLNSTAAEVTNTDYVDTFSSGFEISSTAPAAINANGGSFIFLAVA